MGEPPTLLLPARYRARLDDLPGRARWYETPEDALELAAECDVVWVSIHRADVIGQMLQRSPRLGGSTGSTGGALPLSLFRDRHHGAGLYSQPISEHVVMCMLAARLNPSARSCNGTVLGRLLPGSHLGDAPVRPAFVLDNSLLGKAVNGRVEVACVAGVDETRDRRRQRNRHLTPLW
jgi:hypothetical protein